ncbi:MAG TPA: MFS transporter [Bryobacteraceae bacterium]|jgi:MFS family permease|nr:MFS transporter [Bryobacteraceae bacterium]
MPHWLNRNVWGMTITSMLSDACYEMVLAVLPGFLPVIHVAAAALGWIEGASDAFSSFLKLFAGWYSDKLGHRKWMITVGYLFTGSGLSIFAAAVTWVPILLGRIVSWFGKGIRGSLRDAMLSESVDPKVRGRAFGFHRAGDTVGAIIGPLMGIALLSILPARFPNAGADAPFRAIFLLSLVPGLAAPVVFAAMVRETVRRPRPQMKLIASIRQLPRGFRRFLFSVGFFGAGDFSPTLLTLAAATLLRSSHGAVRAAQLAAFLYAVRNIIYAAAAFPIGALADRMPKLPLLSAGYFCEVFAAAMMALLFFRSTASVAMLAIVFAVSGVFAAAKDTLEGAIPPDFTDAESRGTVYGTLGAVNGGGDLFASAVTGTLWTAVSPVAGFGLAALLMAAGAVSVLRAATRR